MKSKEAINFSDRWKQIPCDISINKITRLVVWETLTLNLLLAPGRSLWSCWGAAGSACSVRRARFPLTRNRTFSHGGDYCCATNNSVHRKGNHSWLSIHPFTRGGYAHLTGEKWQCRERLRFLQSVPPEMKSRFLLATVAKASPVSSDKSRDIFCCHFFPRSSWIQ